MKTLPDKSVDLFICDLPYGCLEPSRKRSDDFIKRSKGIVNTGSCSWDIPIDLNAFWLQVERLMKNDHTPIIQFCNTKFGYDLIKSKESWFRYDLVWNKMRGVSFLSANKMPMKSHEMIYVFSKKGANYYRKDIEGDFKANCNASKGMGPSRQYGTTRKDERPDNTGKRCVLSVINNGTAMRKGGHPTEKPAELYKFLIERYSNEGDTVLDPTFGSGNSGLASTELKRKYIGIEKDEKFFNAFFTKNEQ
jgi:site-specific DNA-methyltransferase (adenine-specific)